ncbi:MAG: sialidase, partial [Parachlamydiaceae bacterium]|nr:sialidase [Parachlamydiaceae bacterium]
NSNDVVGDNFWLWRADHGVSPDAVGWSLNTADHGLIVNGNNVTIYGLAVEHFQKTQTLWNGENGRVYFYQCELPYDPPTQESWKNGTVDGYPGYKIANNVQNHEAWGLGVYSYFRDANDIFLESAIEAPVGQGIKLRHMISVWLNGNKNGSESGIRHVLNDRGNAAISNVKKGTSIGALDL